MDDTPARVNRPDDLAGRSAEEIVGRDTGAARAPGDFATTAVPRPESSDESSDDADRRTRDIRAEIEQTREEMSETIEAIQERIRPRNLVADAADRVRHSAKEKVTSMAHNAGRRAQAMMHQTEGVTGQFSGGRAQNAIPLALIGLGAAWMLWNRSRSDGDGYRQDRNWSSRYGESPASEPWSVGGETRHLSRTDVETYGEYGGYGETEIYGGGGYREYSRERGFNSGLMRRITNNPIPAALASAGLAWLAFSSGSDEEWHDSQDLYSGSMGSRVDRPGTESQQGGVGEMASHAMDTAREAVSRAQEGTRELAHRAQEYASGTTRRVRGRSRGVQHEVQHLMNSNPLLMGAGAFMLGAAVGLVVPETEREHEFMGETRDRVFERAQERARDVARNTVEEVKGAAGEAVGRIASEVVGITGDEEKTKKEDRKNA